MLLFEFLQLKRSVSLGGETDLFLSLGLWIGEDNNRWQLFLIRLALATPVSCKRPQNQRHPQPLRRLRLGTKPEQIHQQSHDGVNKGQTGDRLRPEQSTIGHSHLCYRLTMQMLAAEEAIKKGLDKAPEVAEQLDVIKQSVMANAYIQDFVKTNKVTDEAVQAEYDRLKATVTGSEYKARHILVEKEADAKAMIAKLKKKPDLFDKLAKEKSKDTNSGANGGDLGWFDLSRMVPEFGAAVSKLEKGKMTEEPVKTQYGYHIIVLEDVRPIEPPPLDQVKPGLTQQLQAF